MKTFYLFFWVSWHSGAQFHGPYVQAQCEALKAEVMAMHQRRNTVLHEIYCKDLRH